MNYRRASDFIRSAAAQGCDLAVLPEYHLTSWCPEHPGFRQASISSNKYLPEYQELAKSLNINIVPGSICEILSTPESSDNSQKELELGNIAYFIAAGTGEIVGRYQKKNLWISEREHLTPCGGDPHQAFETPLKHPDGRPVKAGLLICWDLAFPEAFRALVADGADIIIIPSCWHLSDVDEAALALNPQSERVFLESATVLRAFENTAAIIFCNSAGLSCVTMPHQGCLGKVEVGEERMLVSEVDLGVLKIAEENYQIRADMQDEDWRSAYKVEKANWGSKHRS